MTRVRAPGPRHVQGWIDGQIEGAEPDLSNPPGQQPRGVIESGQNFIATAANRLEVRGGSEVKASFTEPGAAALSKILAVVPFNPTGAAVVGHHAGTSRHYAYRMTVDLDFFTGSEATSRHDLVWNVADPARPVCAELFETLYVADASAYASRQNLVALGGGGTVTSQVYDLDGVVGAPATGGIKAYCLAAYNGVLFVAGYDNEVDGEAKEMVRHSFLGRAPSDANGFDKDAWNKIGAQGVPVTAMCPGRTILLIAKPNELYRLSGAGRGLPGWQYTVQPVDSTKGHGCSNPLALAHFEGQWYGVGDAGPFTTDGTEVWSLVNARRQSWRQVTNLDRAWVTPHPDRRVILFGFQMTPTDAGRSATYPYVVWVWDVDRETWSTNWKFSADIAHASAVGTASGPSASPGGGSAPTVPPTALTVDDASATTTSLAVSWTNGDVTAQTEVYLRTGTAGSGYWQTFAAGVSSGTLTGVPSSAKHWVKIRHTKSGIPTAFTAEEEAFTRLTAPTPPTLELFVANEIYVDNINHTADGADLQLERDTVLIHAFTAAAVGLYDHNDAGLVSSQSYTYRARAFRSDWPAAINASAYCDDVVGVAP